MDPNKVKDVMVYVVAGILISAPIFYVMGTLVAGDAYRGALNDVKMKYDMATRALELETKKVGACNDERMRLEADLDKLTKKLNTIYSAVADVEASGNAEDVAFTTKLVHIVPRADFCIDVNAENQSDLQKIFNVQLRGDEVSGKKKEITLYPQENRSIQICGRVEGISARAELVVNGNNVLNTTVVVE